ncbi:MAG: metallophosphoesterase [Clostridia bacterium]|nr:metallophosphoesterase [Clostridia bacterium]
MLFFACVKVPETPQTTPAAQVQTEDVTIVAETDIVPAAAVQTPVPMPTPDATEPPTQQPTDAPSPSAQTGTYAAAEGVYTIAWISDPQHYSKKFPEYYYAMTGFLRDHCEEMHLKYVINTGDLVHNTDLDSEWQVALTAQSYIDDIPNGVLAGNHDILDPYGYKIFTKYFGEKHYADKPWYGGSFEDNRGHYDLLTIGETDYIFVYMGFAPTKKAFTWVYDTFRAYPDRVGVLCLHDYYTKTQTLSEDGKKWYDLVVKRTPNVYLVLCGHKYGAYCFPESFDDDGDGKADRTVYQMLFNYQASLHDGGGGYLRLIQIDEAAGTMHNMTYSPVFEDFNRFDDPSNREEYYPFDERNEEFTLPLPWRIDQAS